MKYPARFVNPLFYRFMRLFIDSGHAERTGQGVQGFLVARCRYFDDNLKDCLDQGLQQLVILVAGYGSRAYRFDELKNWARAFEVDYPQKQHVKMKKVGSILGGLPGYVTGVWINFCKCS